MSDFIPNSFQTPNAYVDRLMPLLTDPEWKVLTYMVRRIFGFQKRQDHISLSQLETGTVGDGGQRLDYGTGLTTTAIRAALKKLTEYKIVIQVAAPRRETNTPALWRLQLDYDEVDWQGLEARKREKDDVNTKRSRNARIAALEKRKSSQPGPVLSDSTGPDPLLSDSTALFCPTAQPSSVRQNSPILSDRRTKSSRNPEGNPESVSPADDATQDSRSHPATHTHTPTHDRQESESRQPPAAESDILPPGNTPASYAKDEYEQEWTELGKAIIEVCRLSPQRAARMAKFRDAREALWRAGKRAADVRRWYESYWRSKRFNPGRCETDPYPQQVADEIERANPRPARPSNDTIVSPGAGTLVKVRSAR